MMRRKAKEQNADLRDEYLHDLTSFAPYHLVYIDESGCDRRMGFRRTGWSRLSVTPVKTERFHRGHRHHILPAYTHRRTMAITTAKIDQAKNLATLRASEFDKPHQTDLPAQRMGGVQWKWNRRKQ